MARGGFSVKGTDKLAGKLRRNANLDDVKNILLLNGAEIQKKAMDRAPVDTGNLKRSIGLFSPIADKGFTVVVKSEAEYSPYLEWGTRWIYPRRFMGSSYFEQRRKFIRDMKRIMK
jgi:HK97 gp10 family phage protein